MNKFNDFFWKIENALIQAKHKIDLTRTNIQQGLIYKVLPTKMKWEVNSRRLANDISYNFRVSKKNHEYATTDLEEFDKSLIQHLKDLPVDKLKSLHLSKDQSSILEQIINTEELDSKHFKYSGKTEPVLTSNNVVGDFIFEKLYSDLTTQYLPNQRKVIGGNLSGIINKNFESGDFVEKQVLDIIYLGEKGSVKELENIPKIIISKKSKINLYDEGNRISLSDEYGDKKGKIHERTRNYFYLGKFEYNGGKTCHMYAGNPENNISVEKQKMPLFQFNPQLN